MTTTRKAKTMKTSQVLTGGRLLPGRVHHILTNGLLNSESRGTSRQATNTNRHLHPSSHANQSPPMSWKTHPSSLLRKTLPKLGQPRVPFPRTTQFFWAKFKRVARVEFFPRAAAVVRERVPSAGRSSSTVLPCTT